MGHIFQITGNAVINIWTQFCQTGSLQPNHVKGQPRILDETDLDLDLVQVLKQIRPSMTQKELKEYIKKYSFDFLYQIGRLQVSSCWKNDLEENDPTISRKIHTWEYSVLSDVH